MSTEVDAHLSFDTQATVDKALSLVDLYSKHNTDLKRIYIKASVVSRHVLARCVTVVRPDNGCRLLPGVCPCLCPVSCSVF